MELHRESREAVDVSSGAVVLEYDYPGDTSRVVLVRVVLGSGARPVAGGQNYTALARLSGVAVSPPSPVLVPAGQTRAVLQGRSLVLDPGDALSVEVHGAAGDTSVDVVCVVMDATPARIQDLTGAGTVPVDHDYGGSDALRVVRSDGAGVAGAEVAAYLSADYSAGRRGPGYVRGRVRTGPDGRWPRPLGLDPDTYTLVVSKPGAYAATLREVAVS